ncbi:MAG: endolytic transglycosylase MltG, partial [Fimbriimonas ginsengisoli]|nr:endolytic transglycosylase MltG [Fimbriimonas ginsengisoli]
ADQLLKTLGSPIRQLVRLSETRWASQNGALLEQRLVTPAKDYIALVRQPAAFKRLVSFPIEGDSLEGYLFPDTYDLPPLLGAKETILRQLRAFEEKVWKPLGKPKNLRHRLIVASIVQLEVAREDERPLVAGVIENRLARKIPLQIDATVLYAENRWGALATKELHSVDSPYNTYEHTGLPPGPICSPGLKSIQAALHPARHDYIFYVALPDGRHIFARTADEHARNVALRRAAVAQEAFR